MHHLSVAVASLAVGAGQKDDEFINSLADEIRNCFGGLNDNEDAAIRAVKKAKDMGKWEELKKAFKERHSKELDVWLPKQLDARTESSYYTLSFHDCEIKKYARIFYSEETANHAHEFYARSWGATHNEELADFVDKVAGYSEGKVGPDGARKLVKMMCCHGELYAKPGKNERASAAAFDYPEGITEREKELIGAFAEVLQYELEDTGNLVATRKVIQMAINEYASQGKENPGPGQPEGGKEEPARGLPIPVGLLPRDLNLPRMPVARIIPNELNLPRMEVPRVNIPSELNLPRVAVPEMKIPTELNLPRMEVPRVNLPRVEVPRVNLPRMEVPRVNLRLGAPSLPSWK